MVTKKLSPSGPSGGQLSRHPAVGPSSGPCRPGSCSPVCGVFATWLAVPRAVGAQPEKHSRA